MPPVMLVFFERVCRTISCANLPGGLSITFSSWPRPSHGRLDMTNLRRSACLLAVSGSIFLWGAGQNAFGAGVNYFNWDAESDTTSNGNVLQYFNGTVRDCTVSHSGLCSMKMNVIGPDGGNQQKGADVNQLTLPLVTVGGPSIYYRTWLMYSPGFNWGVPGVANVKTERGLLNVSQNRFMTGHMRSDAFLVAECEFVSGFGGGCLTTSGVPNNDFNIRIPFDVQAMADGKWHEYVVRIKPNSTPTAMDAEFQVWVDGFPVGLLTGWRLATTSAGWIEAWDGWMVTPYFQMNGDSSVGGTVWADDFSTDDSWNSLIPGSPFGAPPPISAPVNLRVQ